MVTLLLFFLGFGALLFGAELLVRGAAQLAAGLGISPLVIGLTIVAYGTGSPELVVSVISSVNNQTDIALGNVIGSNIINVLCILGLSAAICPLIVHQQLIRLDVPIMIAITLLMWVAASSGVIGFWWGILFLVLMVGYTLLVFKKSKGEKAEEFIEEYRVDGKLSSKRIAIDCLMVVVGIALLVIGSDWLVQGAVYLANVMGVSELIISLTIIALGTSLPELATSIVAAVQGKREIAVGNVVGSNIFNILAVIGTAAIVAPNGITIPENALNFDIPVMSAVAVACLPIFFSGHEIDRWEGIIFFGYYIAYTTYLVLHATENAWLSAFSDGMLYFVIPLTLLTLGVSLYRHFTQARS